MVLLGCLDHLRSNRKSINYICWQSVYRPEKGQPYCLPDTYIHCYNLDVTIKTPHLVDFAHIHELASGFRKLCKSYDRSRSQSFKAPSVCSYLVLYSIDCTYSYITLHCYWNQRNGKLLLIPMSVWLLKRLLLLLFFEDKGSRFSPFHFSFESWSYFICGRGENTEMIYRYFFPRYGALFIFGDSTKKKIKI